MKKIFLILLAFVSFAAYAQPGSPDANGTITPGPPDWVTGVVPGDGELKLQLGYLNARGDSSKAVFNYVDSTAAVTVLTADSASMGAVYYSDTYWEDLRVPLTNTRINPANSEPDFEDRGDGLFAWGFDADSDSSWVLNFTAQTPHERKDSTGLEAHIHWDPETSAAGNVVWKLVISTANINGEWTATDTLRIVAAAGEVALQYQLDDFGMVPGSDTLRISSGILGSLARMGDAPDDTYGGIAYGVEIDFHYQINSPGSREEIIK